MAISSPKLILRKVLTSAECFWQHHPALLYGISSLLGVSFALSGHRALLLPILCLYLPLLIAPLPVRNGTIRLALSFFLLLCFALSTQRIYQLPLLPKEGVMGTAELTIHSIKTKKNAFGESFAMQGTLHGFTPYDPKIDSIRNGTFQLTLPKKRLQYRPEASKRYRVQGKVSQMGAQYRLRVQATARWEPLASLWNLVEWRYAAQQRFSAMLQQQMPRDPLAATFLASLVTGNFSDAQLSSTLGRLGLQHVLAISGFHFAIVASICSLGLGLILPQRIASAFLLTLLFGYLLFLGSGASILRAWTMATVVLAGELLGRRTTGLNALGVALLLSLFLDPAVSQSVAFQLSFLATAAILLFFSPLEIALQKLFPKRTLSEIATMGPVDQHAILLLGLFREGLALGVAVHLLTIPLSLFYFQSFPWLSLLYNLFFPFLVSGSMLLLLVTLPLHAMAPWMASWLYSINETYTRMLLNLASTAPIEWHMVWRVGEWPAGWLIGYLTIAALAGIALAHYRREQREFASFV